MLKAQPGVESSNMPRVDCCPHSLKVHEISAALYSIVNIVTSTSYHLFLVGALRYTRPSQMTANLLKSPPQTWDYTLPPPSQTRPSSPSNPSAPCARHPHWPTSPSTPRSLWSCPAAYLARPDSQSYPRCSARSRMPVAARLRLREGGRGAVPRPLVRRASAGIGIARFARALRRRRTRIGIFRRPGRCLLVGLLMRWVWEVLTSRMPTQDSAMLTSRLSWAHLRAR
jgi:hypothetical protein